MRPGKFAAMTVIVVAGVTVIGRHVKVVGQIPGFGR